jgi:hypothetical protein
MRAKLVQWVLAASDDLQPELERCKCIRECNYLQAMEGIGSSYVSFLHGGNLDHYKLHRSTKGAGCQVDTASRFRWSNPRVSC